MSNSRYTPHGTPILPADPLKLSDYSKYAEREKTPQELDTEALAEMEILFNEEETKLRRLLVVRAETTLDLARKIFQARIDMQEKRVNALGRAMHALRERKSPLITTHPFEHGHGGACRVCGAGPGVHAL